MPSTELPIARDGVVRRLLEQVRGGTDVVVSAAAETGQALLDDAAARLAGQRCRVLQVAGTSGSLSGLMARVAGQPDFAAQDDEVLERGFKRLTVPDAECDQIVLLIGDAHLLQRPALRFIQFACRAGTVLRLVLVGEGLPAALDGDDFALLRARLTAAPALLPQVVPAAVAKSVPLLVPAAPAAMLASAPDRRRRIAVWSGVGVAMAASVGLGFWVGRADLGVETAREASVPVPPATLAAQVLPPAPPVQPVPPQVAASVPVPAPAMAANAPPAPAEPGPAAGLPPQDNAKTEFSSAAALPSPDPGHGLAASRVRAAPPLPKQFDARPKELGQGPPTAPSRPRPTQLARGSSAYPRPADQWDDPYARPSYGWRPVSPRAGYEPGYPPVPPYIGTYTTDGYGVRNFRFGP